MTKLQPIPVDFPDGDLTLTTYGPGADSLTGAVVDGKITPTSGQQRRRWLRLLGRTDSPPAGSGDQGSTPDTDAGGTPADAPTR